MTEPTPPKRSLFEELKRRRVVRVAIGYGAAAFVVLQAADIIFPALSLPESGFRALVIATLVGFVIAVVLSWLFDWTPEGFRRTRGDEAKGPSATKIGPVRAALLIGATFVIGFGLLWARATRASGSVVLGANVIAVVPFSTSGSSEERLGDGLVDLISRNLDEVEGLRLVDPRVVLHHWNRLVGDGPATRETERELGRTVEAGSVLSGSLVQLGEQVAIDAELVAIDGTELASASIEGGSDDLLALVDRLSIDLLRDIWRATSDVPSPAVGEVTTDNLEAMQFFLDGERHYRASDWLGALDAYARAVEADGQFAFAYYRLTRTLSWVGNVGEGRQSAYIDLALMFADRLPERIRRLALAERLWLDGAFDASIDTLRSMSEQYPDDAEVWLRYADNIYHRGHEGAGPLAPPVETQVSGFERALLLDPSFLPAVVHPIEVALRHDDPDRLARYIDLVAATSAPDTAAVAILRAAGGVLRDPTDAPSVLRSFQHVVDRADRGGMAGQAVQAVIPALLRAAATLDSAGQRALLTWLGERMAGPDESSSEAGGLRVRLLVATGRLHEAAAEADLASTDPGLPRAVRRDPVYAGYVGSAWLTDGEMEPTPLVRHKGLMVTALWERDMPALRTAVDSARAASAEPAGDWATLVEAGEGFIEVLEGARESGLARVEASLSAASLRADSFGEPLRFLWLVFLAEDDAGLERALPLLEQPWPGSPAFEVRRLAAAGQALRARGRTEEAAEHFRRFAAALALADPGLLIEPLIERASELSLARAPEAASELRLALRN